MNRREFVTIAAAGAAALAIGARGGQPVQPAAVSPPIEHVDAKEMLARTTEFIKGKQDKETGAWGVPAQGPAYPAITGLVVAGLLANPLTQANDGAVMSGVAYMLKSQQADGGIYDKILPSYNTSICLAALAKVKNPDAAVQEAIKKARAFLRTIQYGEDALVRDGVPDSAQKVGKDHAFYGGVGYGHGGRPDLSNTAFFVEAMHESGVDGSDPAMKRALVFLQRTQMLEKVSGPSGEIMVNDMPYAKGSQQGGFIYSTSESKDKVGIGQTYGGMVDETLSDGTVASRLRSYGSMTYSGFKSYLYAGLKKDDPRVQAARGWMSKNYSLEENPGAGSDGLYYFLLVFAKAMAAYGEPTLEVARPNGSNQTRVWRDDLTAKLATLAEPDGSFKSVGKRWMENDPVLISAYSLNALALAVA